MNEMNEMNEVSATSATAPLDPALPSPAGRRLGNVMVGIAIVGVLVAAVGTVLAWQFVGRLDDSSSESLTVTIDTLDTVDDTIVLAGDVFDATSAALDTAATTLDAVAASFDDADGVVTEIDELVEVVGPSLGDATTSLRQLAAVGDAIDGLLEGLDDLPLTPNYDPDTDLGTSIRQIADVLEPLPEAFDGTADDLDDFGTSIGRLRRDVSQLSIDLDTVVDELEATEGLADQYRRNVRDARAVAVDTRDGLGDDVGWLRVVLVIGGINFGLAQLVPFWIGRRLRRGDATV
ncbi:hypothetical protein [Ilumatobacter coccineus]|uniref:Uncharacterized protein n=1 Tax=Ilumatobacter coccineus (strain NBRC 103263 / KCTC 29153 / YM16-304) TaxID=1313172 RepID=A0A6C7E3S8_ILUCY|nr:hypothetical protein [Ilumatobacter coccineus]BAN00942.1 hypothetical protein YM304_06280 [Ilumatobacter coccineus YM16-304]